MNIPFKMSRGRGAIIGIVCGASNFEANPGAILSHTQGYERNNEILIKLDQHIQTRINKRSTCILTLTLKTSSPLLIERQDSHSKSVIPCSLEGHNLGYEYVMWLSEEKTSRIKSQNSNSPSPPLLYQFHFCAIQFVLLQEKVESGKTLKMEGNN